MHCIAGVGPALAGQDADERADLLKGEAGLQNALFEVRLGRPA